MSQPLINPNAKYLEPNNRGSFANYQFDSAYFFYYMGIQPTNVDIEILKGVLPTVTGLSCETKQQLINKAVLTAKMRADEAIVEQYLGKNPGEINID